jgi:alpha-ketoglutarate-dependent taurine dioxygenase
MNAPVQLTAHAQEALGPEVACEPYAPGRGLPLFVTPRDRALAHDLDAAVAWLRERQDAFDALLCDAGALVLRDFAFRDTAGFNRAVEHYPDMEFGYLGGATPRSNISGRAFEATRAPAASKLAFHQEMAYLPRYPKKLAFFCNHAPDTGGETLIADVRRFDAEMSRAFRDQVHRRGVRYKRNFREPGWSSGDAGLDTFHRPWTEAMGTADRREAEAGCEAMGLAWDWEANGSFSVIYDAPGFVAHPRTGREIWFNQIPSQSPNVSSVGTERAALYDTHYGTTHPRPYHTTYGDGGEIAPADLMPVYPLLESLEVAFPWRDGDLMILDNFYTFHGRNPYTGHRDVQVALLG